MNLTTRYKVSDDKAAYIGINMADVSADVSQNYGIPTGVCIMSVVDGSPQPMRASRKAMLSPRLMEEASRTPKA